MKRTCEYCSGIILGRGIRFCGTDCSRRWHKADWQRRNGAKNADYVKTWRQRNVGRKRRPRPIKRPRFVGVDAEAIDGKLIMISAADALGKAWSVVAPKDQELSTAQSFGFLVSLPGGSIKCGFWFEFDVNMMLRDLGREHLERLRDKGHTYWANWSIRHIPGKRFSVKNRLTGASATIWDMSNFVRSSFVKLLRGWDICPESEIAEIADMKALRSTFSWTMVQRIARYNENECRLLAVAAGKIWQAAKDAGITLRSYYGGGSIASELMRRNKINEHSEEWDNELAVKGYYGGRFETSLIGYVKGPVWVYDINSAYPYQAFQLPSLKGAKWTRRRAPRLGPGLHLCKWNVPGVWGPFPVRRTVGSLCYPSNGAGWYYWPEVESALKLYPDNIEIRRTYSLIVNDDTKPFEWIKGEAAHRLRLKAEGDYSAEVLKLGLNSVYGKLAQRVGKAPYHNTVWASLITSGTRGMLLDAIALAPEHVISMATDSIFSRTELPLTIGPNLGDWSVRKVDWLFFAQAGVYFWPEADGIVRKSRGFSGKGLTYELVKTEWNKQGINGVVKIPQTRFIGYRTGLRREGTWRTWMDTTRNLRFDPWPRRIADRMETTHCVTRPPTAEEVKMSEILDLMELDETYDEWEELKEQPEPPIGDSIT